MSEVQIELSIRIKVFISFMNVHMEVPGARRCQRVIYPCVSVTLKAIHPGEFNVVPPQNVAPVWS